MYGRSSGALGEISLCLLQGQKGGLVLLEGGYHLDLTRWLLHITHSNHTCGQRRN